MTTTNFMQQVGVPHCFFCHKNHKDLIGNIVCKNDTGLVYFPNTQPTECSKDCKMYDGTPVLKDEKTEKQKLAQMLIGLYKEYLNASVSERMHQLTDLEKGGTKTVLFKGDIEGFMDYLKSL